MDKRRGYILGLLCINIGFLVFILEDPVPLLFVDVNLGMGRTERIVVHEGDRSDELAARFAASHSKNSS